MPHNDENWLNGKIDHIKRTEQEILDDFKKLGYEFIEFTICYWLRKCNREIDISIVIDKELRNYRCVKDRPVTQYYLGDIGMKEHKLLNELFTIWGWLDE